MKRLAVLCGSLVAISYIGGGLLVYFDRSRITWFTVLGFSTTIGVVIGRVIYRILDVPGKCFMCDRPKP